MRTRLETLHIDLQALDALDDKLNALETFGRDYVVPDDVQSEIRMLFNEAIAGGANLNGDAGPTLTPNHARDCITAAKKILTLRLNLAGDWTRQ